MSTRFATGRINSVYLTRDGTVGATPCKVRVEGEQAFANPSTLSSVAALDFSVHSQIFNRSVKGIEFAIIVEYCPESVLALILTQLNNALAALTAVRVVIDSLTDFDVLAVPVVQAGALYTFESRSGGIVENAQFRFISTGVGV